MIFSSGSTPVSNNINKIKILCLHGKGSDGLRFQKTIEPLEELLRSAPSATRTSDDERIHGIGFDFDYLTAPFPIDDDINNGM